MTEWEIRNLGADPVRLLATRLPHGRLRWDEVPFTPAVDIGSSEARRIRLEARCREPAGAEFENAFLILRISWRDEEWLVLARLRVRANAGGAPHAATVLISAQRVGFSAVREEPWPAGSWKAGL